MSATYAVVASRSVIIARANPGGVSFRGWLHDTGSMCKAFGIGWY